MGPVTVPGRPLLGADGLPTPSRVHATVCVGIRARIHPTTDGRHVRHDAAQTVLGAVEGWLTPAQAPR